MGVYEIAFGVAMGMLLYNSVLGAFVVTIAVVRVLIDKIKGVQ